MRAPARIALFVAIAPILLAASNRLRLYPNPVIRAFSIAQTPDGFLWLAAADGLYRFDGFHYHKMTAFPMDSARFVAVTPDGSLWAGDFQGLVRMRAGRFEKVLPQEVDAMTASSSGVFVEPGTGLTEVGLDASLRRFPYRVRREVAFDASGRLWGVCTNPIQVCWIDPKNPAARHDVGEAGDFFQAYPDAQGRIWLGDAERAGLLENGRFVPRFERRATTEGNRAGPLMAGRNGHLWFLGETTRDVTSQQQFRDRADHARFAPLAGFEDSHGHVWISSSGQGLVEWIPDPSWERWFPEDFSGEAAISVLRDARGSIVAATQKYLYRKNGEAWKRLTTAPRRYDSLVPFEDGFLASIRDYGVAALSADGKILERLPDLQPGRNQYRKIVRDAKGRYWVGAKEGLLRIEGRRGSLHFVRELLPKMQPGELQQAVAVDLDRNGRFWVGYVDGIAWLDEQDQWHAVEPSAPVNTVRSIAVDPHEIWVAYRRPGSFSRLVENGGRWESTEFSFPPHDTYFINRDSRGWIWRGTPGGVYVSDGRHFAQDDWLHFHMGNGLAANELDQYGFFEDTDGSVWIAGEEGITHLRPDASWFAPPPGAPAPSVTRVEVDGQVFLQPRDFPRELPSSFKTLRIDLGTLAASPFRDAGLQWRLAPGAWRPASDGTLDLRNLARGNYSLEAAYIGGAPASIYTFRVGPAGPWISWWWWLVPALAIAPFALRPPVLAKARFRAGKAAFLLRRRFQRSTADSVPNNWSGEILNGRYRAGPVISRGGFSIVYEAQDLQRPGARIALKVLSRTARKDSWMRDRFAHEVSALRSVEHPGVVQILDSWISPLGEPCLAMPLLEGHTLREAMTGFEGPRAALLIRRIGQALGEVHSRGIVHRDLKPENIILIGNDQPVIVDFGSAGLRSAEDELAETTLIAGSFHYMAPERLTGRYSPATDVYSLAVIILELLSGKRLANLQWSFSDESFEEEISQAVGNKTAGALLTPALDPDPRRRPQPIEEWSDRIASAIESA